MKKLLNFILISLVIVSCYDDYILDNVFNSVYFPYQNNVRTYVVGEGTVIEVGAALGGVIKNKVDRNVNFELRNAMITPSVLDIMKSSSSPHIKESSLPVGNLRAMPQNYYTISSTNTMIIKKGEVMGSVALKIDSVNFLNDSVNTRYATYALPFYITKADADSILEPKRYSIIALKFENMLYGNYWHGGKAVINRPGKADSVFTYKTTIPTSEPNMWVLTTQGPNTLFCNGYKDKASGTKNEMKLVLKGSTVFVSAAPGSTYIIQPDGNSEFNRARLLQNRKIFLKYKYTDPGNGFTYHCNDTLTFRNRIRDGVNEWQDEDPTHY
jgi:hypothetical protein